MNTHTVGRYSAAEILEMIRTKKSDFWSRVRKEKPLEFFHAAAQRVPAYKDFLKKNKIDPVKIKTFQDFQLIPPVSKKNYLREYPLEKLCWDGSLKKPSVFTVTSGSTGEPFYFPRNDELDKQSAVYHQLFLENDPSIKDKSSLVIVGFGMGVWIGGLITYQAFRYVSETGIPLSILTPGTNKKEIYDAVKRLAHKYDNLVLCGYPPFIKDLIEEGVNNGINWKKYKVKIVFAAESFTEKFRQHICKETGMKNSVFDTMNIYGSADLGTMAQETPLSIAIRKILLKKANLHDQIFEGAHNLPTLAQYIPFFINFDLVDKEILCTADSVLPLVRYAIGDHGNVMSFEEIKESFRNQGTKMTFLRKEAGRQIPVNELPFVAIYERSDLSTKLYGAIIYPDHIKEGLQVAEMTKILTGRFAVITKTDKRHNEYLELNVELRPRVKSSEAIRGRVMHLAKSAMQRHNAEYNYLSSMMPDRVDPKIVLWKYEDPLYFKPGIKQRWAKMELKAA